MSQDWLERDISYFLQVPRHFTRGSYDLWASVRWHSFAICKTCIFKTFLHVRIVTLTTRLLFYYWRVYFLISQRVYLRSRCSERWFVSFHQFWTPFADIFLFEWANWFYRLNCNNDNTWDKVCVRYFKDTFRSKFEQSLQKLSTKNLLITRKLLEYYLKQPTLVHLSQRWLRN